MSKGAVLQLAAYGQEDLLFTGNPSFTFFKSVYHRHSNFAMETIINYFEGEPGFGRKVRCPITRYGDLIQDIRMILKLPALTGTSTVATYPYVAGWINGIGQSIIHTCDLIIGDERIDRLYGTWLDIWTELTVPTDRRDAVHTLIGKHDFYNCTKNSTAMSLKVQLPFWFTQQSALALPLIAIQEQNVAIEIQFRPFSECWISSTGDAPQPVTQFTECYLEVDYIYLEEEERKRIIYRRNDYVIEQLQMRDYQLNPQSNLNYIGIDFRYIVKEIIWIYQQRNRAIENDWQNYTATDPVTGSDVDPLIEAKLLINGSDRMSIQDPVHYRLVQPLKCHSRVADRYIYNYSYTLHADPDTTQPHGGTNYSCVADTTLWTKTQAFLTDAMCIVYARSTNMMRIENGFIHILYAT